MRRDNGAGTHQVIERLPWDSQHFGLEIGQVTHSGLPIPFDMKSFDCVYWPIGSDHPGSIWAAQDYRFELVDTRITFEFDEDGARQRGSVRPATVQDLPSLRDLARYSHTASRFFQDSRFDRDKCADLYARWITRDFERGDVVNCLVGHLGYCTGRVENSVGRIGLFAVADGPRRSDLGRELFQKTLVDLFTQGAKTVQVSTQARNIRAQRFYERNGGLTKSIEYWFHKWNTASPLTRQT